MRKKIIALVILLAVLIVAFVIFNDPPIGTRSSDDVSDYMRTNKFVKLKLESEFAQTLPESIPQDTKNTEYHYQYRCGLIGDASFYINLRVEYDSAADMIKETERLQNLKPLRVLSEEGTTYLIFDGTDDSFDAYLDDLTRDGALFHFNIVTVDESSNTIEYSLAYHFDGSDKPEGLTETILNVKNALPRETMG